MTDQPLDCVGAGGCLTTGADECTAQPCNAAAGPILSFLPPPVDEPDEPTDGEAPA